MTIRMLNIDLPDADWERIDSLAAEVPHTEDPIATLTTTLLTLVQKGVARPRSREREIVIECFGEESLLAATRRANPRADN